MARMSDAAIRQDAVAMPLCIISLPTRRRPGVARLMRWRRIREHEQRLHEAPLRTAASLRGGFFRKKIQRRVDQAVEETWRAGPGCTRKVRLAPVDHL